jgi:D-psicose/D-tagatose/L-ribulose 3-epimerase
MRRLGVARPFVPLSGFDLMKLGLINSAWAQAGRETAFGIGMTKEIGFDSIDIFTDPLDIDVKERKLIKDECDRVGLPIVSVACVAVGLIDFNPSVQRFHIDRVRAYLDLAYQFEAKNVLLVLGEYIWQREVIPPGTQWATAVENVQVLGRYAESLGLEIALELEPFHLSLLNDVESMARFLDEVGLPTVKANLDISHLVLARQLPARIELLRGKVAHVHISDCDGNVHGDLPPGRGVIDFVPYLRAIKDLGLNDATISIELEYAPEPDRIVDWVREAYHSTSELMRAAGLRP